ncbi:MAG: hypothetical protein ACJ8AW_47665 [Rhodopila sp.]
MKVAIVHYWLVGMRGEEKVVETLCDMFPEADLFTHVYVPAAVSEAIRRHRVTTTFIGALSAASRLYKRYLPLITLLHGYANPLKRLDTSESVNLHKCLILLDSCQIHATRCLTAGSGR